VRGSGTGKSSAHNRPNTHSPLPARAHSTPRLSLLKAKIARVAHGLNNSSTTSAGVGMPSSISYNGEHEDQAGHQHEEETMEVTSMEAIPAAEAVRVYSGFTEHTYRLVFPFEDKFAPDTPLLLTILPSGVVENNKVLDPKAEKGLIAFTYPQSISDECANFLVEQQGGGDGNSRTLNDTAFVWRRADGTNALVQTWATNINEKFCQDFEISKGVNPDPEKFSPQAVSEFKEAMVRLFGPSATACPTWFCHKKLESTSPAVVGSGEEVLAYLKENTELMRKVAIASIDSDGLGFVADGTNGKGEKFEKCFRVTRGEQCVVYRKTGWDTMGSVKPLHQFLLDAEFHELGLERNASSTWVPTGTGKTTDLPHCACNGLTASMSLAARARSICVATDSKQGSAAPPSPCNRYCVVGARRPCSANRRSLGNDVFSKTASKHGATTPWQAFRF